MWLGRFFLVGFRGEGSKFFFQLKSSGVERDLDGSFCAYNFSGNVIF